MSEELVVGKWPKEFVWGGEVAEAKELNKPAIAMFFNLECPACVTRGIPFLKRLHEEYGSDLAVFVIHTSFGHKLFEREEVVPTLLHFSEKFAKLPYPVALDLDGSIAESWQALGTPFWIIFNKAGELVRSIYGSQGGAQTRLEYLLEELVAE